MRLTLRTRIVLMLAPLLILVTILGAAGTVLLYRLGGSIDLILRENYRSVIAMERLNEALERIDSSFQFALAGQSEKAREQFDRNWKLYQENLEIEQKNITLPGESELVDELTTLSDEYRRHGNGFHAQPREGPEHRDLYFGTPARRGLLNTFEQIKKVSREISRMNHENMVAASQASHVLATKSLSWFGVGLVAAVILALVLSMHTIRTILHPIQAMTEAARGITEGNLDQVVPHFSKDELGQLAEAFNTMARHLRDSRQSHSARLLRAQQTSQASIDSFPDPILVVDSEGQVEMANPAAQRVLGVAVMQLAQRLSAGPAPSGTSPLAWQPPEALRLPLAAAIQDQRPYLPESFAQALSLRVDSREHFFLPRILPVRDHRGNTLGAAVLLQDVTRFRLLDEIKSNLVATVSHELKTPLTSIQLDIHVLLDETVGPLTPKQMEFLIDARENADLLLARVNNLLDLTRLEHGREQLDTRPAQPADLLRAAADAIQPKTEDKGVELEIEASAELPAVAVDAARFQHALGNILENAVTYTNRGGRITLSASPADHGVMISVADTGVGIPPEHLPNVFDRFFRVPGQSRGTGTGLGLAIAREIVTAHGGTITCESHTQSGTVFRITLPAWVERPRSLSNVEESLGH
jgi:two-component system, NtrC family, sensor histidine kinase KinB